MEALFAVDDTVGQFQRVEHPVAQRRLREWMLLAHDPRWGQMRFDRIGKQLPRAEQDGPPLH